MDKFVKITSMSTGDKENEVDSEMESEIQHTTKRKRETSVVWQVFKKCKETNMAVCKQCGKQYKTGGNTTNLMDHLKRMHPSLLNEKPLDKPDCMTKFLERDILYSNNSEKKKRIDKLVLNMVASDVLPLNVVATLSIPADKKVTVSDHFNLL
ncbi:uncharacterized protein LOC117134678 isoform X2 [Drosophila busckii]|uniref:uncharacterized protein LOC117134678 isoform X2 n=1 Tax=Drosophila busckii TaxID=30019 RepID=UPI0014333E32|nr:uncharacterized protein LOC117134678 isoform X2 [Drosophila busckii]